MEQTSTEIVQIELSRIVRIIEEHTCEVCIVCMCLIEVFERRLGLGSFTQFNVRAILVIHVKHVMIACIMGDMQLLIISDHFLQGITHGENTTNDDCRTRIDICLSVKDLGEACHHALCYFTVLLCPKRCKFTIATLSLLTNELHLG